MSDCQNCGIEKACRYPYKPCDCVHQRKYWSKERREEFDKEKAEHEASARNEENYLKTC